MTTDFNAEVNTELTSETKLTTASGRVANFAYDSVAYTEDLVDGTDEYNYNKHQNIPLGDATTLKVDSSILNKGVRSQASSLTRMMLNHFYGRTSFNVNKLADHLKAFLTTFKSFIKEGSNEWSPTVLYETGDVVYFLTTLNHEPCKRTFECILDCPRVNLPPVYTDGSLINTNYWKELSGKVAGLTVGTANSGQTNVATFNGSVTINGNITQHGTPYEIHAEQLYTKKDNIITREGATGALPSGSYSGIKVNNYNGNGANGILAYRSDGTAVVGDETGNPAEKPLQPLLTRAEEGSPALANGGILVWNSSTKRAETTTLSGKVAGLTVGTANSGQTNVATFNGSVTINGNITQHGTPYEIHAEQLYTKKDNIITREGATGALPSGSYSGIKVNNYNGNGANGILAYRSDGTAVVGDETGNPAEKPLQPLLTRAEEGSPALANGGILVWNSSTKRAETTTLAGVIKLNVTANLTVEAYNSNATARVTAPNVTLTLGVVAEFVEITIFAMFDTIIAFNGITDTLPAYENCKLQYIAGTWYVTSNESAGDVKGNATDAKPFGTLLCDGSVLTGTDKTSYPRLWNALTVDNGLGGTTGKYNLATDPSTVRRLPDFRECVLVGAGRSSRPSTELVAHDVYTVGQFKDDQFKSHNHAASITGGEHSHRVKTAMEGPFLPVLSVGGHTYFPLNEDEDSSIEGHSHNITIHNNGGETTHGKQVGVNFVIKY